MGGLSPIAPERTEVTDQVDHPLHEIRHDRTDAGHFLIGPFGTDDQADDTVGKLEDAGNVLAVVAPLVEPARAMARLTLC